MTGTVTLQWDDEEKRVNFLRIHRDYKRQDWLGDSDTAELMELFKDSEIVKDRSEEENGDG